MGNVTSMTGYINDINQANTQVLMEFHDKGYAGNIYEYGVKRESVSHWQNTNYYAYDGRGSVSDLVDGAGEVQMYHSYEPDGQTTLRFRGYIKNPYRYNAERVDYVPGIADFQYLRARYYRPDMARFITQDTVWGNINVPLTQNLYAYVGNNPINRIDPSGHRAMAIDGSGGGKKGILDDGYQFGDLTQSFGNAVSDIWESTAGARTDAYMKDPSNAYNAANYWLIGIPDLIAGMWNTSGENTSEMLAKPNIETIGNWLTLGGVDMVEGTFNPETPWSTEHWMNSLGTASLVTAGINGSSAGKPPSLTQNAQQGIAMEQAKLHGIMDYLDNGNNLLWTPKTAGMINAAGANGVRVGCEGGDSIVGTDYNLIRPTQDVVNPQKVIEYTSKLKKGEVVPPIEVVEIPGKGMYIVEGHHRYIASQQTGIPIGINISQGQGPVGLPNWSDVQWKAYINEEQFWGE